MAEALLPPPRSTAGQRVAARAACEELADACKPMAAEGVRRQPSAPSSFWRSERWYLTTKQCVLASGRLGLSSVKARPARPRA